MTIENRRFIRFLLDIPAIKRKTDGQVSETVIKQVSIGGCLTDWDDVSYPGDEFRMEIQLPNKNILPLMCKVIYKFENAGIGVKFHEITQFEQELLANIISEKLENEGLPLLVDPFTMPLKPAKNEVEETDERIKREELVEEVIATQN